MNIEEYSLSYKWVKYKISKHRKKILEILEIQLTVKIGA